MDTKSLLGAVTILVGIISYSFYFRNIFSGKTKPEAFSWLIWSVLAGITYFAQVSQGGGPGTWATLITAVACLTISLTAFYRKCAKLRALDIASLVGTAVALGVWCYTKNPLLAVKLVVVIGACGFVPTFAKAFKKPTEETLTTFLLNALKFFIAIFALESWNTITLLYPIAMVAMNTSLGLLIISRRARH